MKKRSNTLARLWAAALTLSLLTLVCPAGAAAQGMDKRRQTTVQTAAVDAGGMKNAVTVRYLNLPWGEATFGYLETGVDKTNNGYYSSRTWPIAHLTLARPVMHQSKALPAGDYVIYITPKGAVKNDQMLLSIASFTPAEKGGTFLKAGNVFADTPADAKVLRQMPVTFTKGTSKIDHLEITMTHDKENVFINLHYGDRTLTETLALN